MFRSQTQALRRGNITVLAAFMSMAMVGMVAFSVDIGYVLSAKEEMQRSADAAALAACWEYGQQLANGSSASSSVTAARTKAQNCVNLNAIANATPTVDLNTNNATTGDVVFGYINDLNNPNAAFDTSDPSLYNAVRVRVRKEEGSNGQVPFFFAKVFGLQGQSLKAEATAGIVRNISGWRTPASGGNLQILPYALDVDTWNSMLAGSGPDTYRWTEATGAVTSGSDGKREMNLFPQGTGSPGNRGTVDIGSSNNSTADIARQIVYGISPADLAYHGGELKFNSCGYLNLNGDTGISAGVKDEFASIIGQKRIIPIFENVTGPGNNAIYKIVQWAGVRILAVKLTGAMNQKYVMIQPAPLTSTGVIQSSSGGSSYVYSPAILYK